MNRGLNLNKRVTWVEVGGGRVLVLVLGSGEEFGSWAMAA
jgi:hypothetical protein